jgi:hypothetical protein
VETKGDHLPEVEPYRLSKLRPRCLFIRYYHEYREHYLHQYRSEVQRLLSVLVRGEGPIHIEHALNRINTRLRLSSSTPAFKEVVQDCCRRGLPNVRGKFLWPRKPVDVKVRISVEGVKETFRSIGYIPQEEIRRAIILIACQSLASVLCRFWARRPA